MIVFKWILVVLVLVASSLVIQRAHLYNDVLALSEVDDEKLAIRYIEPFDKPLLQGEIESAVSAEESDLTPRGLDSQNQYSALYTEYQQRAKQGDAEAQYILSIFHSVECSYFASFGDEQIDRLKISRVTAEFRDCIRLRADLSAETRRALSDQWLKAAADSGFGLAQLNEFQWEASPAHAGETKWREYMDLIQLTFSQMQALDVTSQVVNNALNLNYYESLVLYFFASSYNADQGSFFSSSDGMNYGAISLMSLRCDVDLDCSSSKGSPGVINKLQSDFDAFEINQLNESKKRIEEIINRGSWEELVAETKR